jgi:hypothetical protein
MTGLRPRPERGGAGSRPVRTRASSAVLPERCSTLGPHKSKASGCIVNLAGFGPFAPRQVDGASATLRALSPRSQPHGRSLIDHRGDAASFAFAAPGHPCQKTGFCVQAEQTKMGPLVAMVPTHRGGRRGCRTRART